jgi:hypothetical protein
MGSDRLWLAEAQVEQRVLSACRPILQFIQLHDFTNDPLLSSREEGLPIVVGSSLRIVEYALLMLSQCSFYFALPRSVRISMRANSYASLTLAPSFVPSTTPHTLDHLLAPYPSHIHFPSHILIPHRYRLISATRLAGLTSLTPLVQPRQPFCRQHPTPLLSPSPSCRYFRCPGA